MMLIIFLYIGVVSIILGSVSLLRLLVILEVLSWLFVVIIPNVSTLNYLIIQRNFFIIRLCRVLFIPFLLIISFLLKLGIPPFHIWFIRVSGYFNKKIFSFMITVHKLIPILILRKVMFRYLCFVVLSLRLIIVGVSLISSRTLFFTLLFSSIVHTTWIVFSMVLRKSFVLFYWIIYNLLFILLITLMTSIYVSQSFLYQRLILSKCWLLISGIPPFIIFWLKVYVLLWFIYTVGIFIRLFIIFVRVFALTAYYRTWHFGSLLERNTFGRISISPFTIVLIFWRLF